jgi:hypothetical protein
MTKTKNRTAAEIEDILRPTSPWDIARFLQNAAIDRAIAEARRDVDMSLQSASFEFDTDVAEVAVDLLQRADAPLGHKLASLLAAKHTLESCPDLPGIKARLDPLYLELASAREREAEEARLASLAAQEKRIALQAAREKALAQLEAAFA